MALGFEAKTWEVFPERPNLVGDLASALHIADRRCRSHPGPIIATLDLTFATEAMAGLRGMEKARFIVVAVGMILVLRFAPNGIIGLLAQLGTTSSLRPQEER